MFTTYGIVDPETQLFVYVGQTGDFDARKRQHRTVHRQKKTRHKKGSLQAWLVSAHVAGIEPVFIVLDVVETEAHSLASENAWVDKLASIGHPLLNRWEEHMELIEAGRRCEQFEAYWPGKWQHVVAEMEPTPKKAGYSLSFPEEVTVKAGGRLVIMPKREGET